MRAIRLPDPFLEELRVYPPELKRKIREAFDELREKPSGKPLEGELAGLFTFRVGRHRIVYRLTETMVEVVAVGPRETIYAETARLLRKG